LELTAEGAPERVRRVLDLGTGTGAIVLALASERKHWQLLGVDAEPSAVALARRNRDELGLMNVELVQSDWFEALMPGERFDVVVSNPPYIDSGDEHLGRGDVRFEPRSALVAGANGLADIAHIVRDAGAFLLPGGWLMLEHGWQQGGAVRGLLAAAGYSEVATRCDLGGRERVTLGRMPAEERLS
jgi:release factor glutamine methyltransferase